MYYLYTILFIALVLLIYYPPKNILLFFNKIMPSKIKNNSKDTNFKSILKYLTLLFIVLILTNPQMKNFKEYLGVSSASHCSKKANFFIFSIYRNYEGDDYLGILLNFYLLKKNFH